LSNVGGACALTKVTVASLRNTTASSFPRSKRMLNIACAKGYSATSSFFISCTKTLFLVSSIGEDTVALQHNAIEASREAGVTHIVKLSAFRATDHSKAPICLWHYQIEQEMQESGMDWTILRPHHFMQNLLTQTEYIINDGVVYSASGD